MAFSRDDLSGYEKQTPVQVDDKTFDPFNPVTATATKADTAPETSTEKAVVTEPTEQAEDGSNTTEITAEPVAADVASPEGEKDPEAEANDQDGKPRGRAQERIEELVGERNALRKYGEYLLTQMEELRKAKQPTQTQTATETATSPSGSSDDPSPTLEDAEFDSVKFAKMQNEWIQKQVTKRVESAVKQLETRQSEVAIRQAFEGRATEFRKNTPDFDIVIANPALPALAQEAARVVVRSESGPAIAYHLAKNPDLAMRVARLDPVGQAAAIGRIEEQLSRMKTDTTKEPSKDTKVAPKKEASKVTKAPPPPKPVSGSAPVQKDPSSMSMDEWVAHDRSRRIAERKAKAEARKAFGR